LLRHKDDKCRFVVPIVYYLMNNVKKNPNE
jgi:hypothetical protein